MLTVKRKVETEEERYGSFDREAAVPHTIDIDYNYDKGRSYREAQNAQAETISYSGRAENAVYPGYIETGKRMPQEEFMPGIDKKEKEERQTAAKTNAKLELKTKAMLAVYLIIVIALAAVVIATGVAISAANARVGKLNNMIGDRSALLVEQNAELNVLNDNDAITGKAVNIGMIKGENAQTIQLIPVGEPTEYQRSTNWFDKFCDFIGGIFGG